MEYMAFTDEAGHYTLPAQPGRDRFTVLSAIIPATHWRVVAERLQKIKKDYGVSWETEVKWTHLRSKKGPLSKLTETQRNDFRKRLFTEIGGDDKLTLVASTMKISAAAQQKWYIQTSDDVYRYTFQFLVERFHLFLADTQDPSSVGSVIIDPRGKKDDAALRKFYQAISARGTHFVKFDRLVESLMFMPSDWSVGIQIADFCVGATHRHLCQLGDEDFNKIKLRFRRGPSGQISGWGIARFP